MGSGQGKPSATAKKANQQPTFFRQTHNMVAPIPHIYPQPQSIKYYPKPQPQHMNRPSSTPPPKHEININVGSSTPSETRKRRLQELIMNTPNTPIMNIPNTSIMNIPNTPIMNIPNTPNLRLPGGLKHIEQGLIQRILADVIDQDATTVVKWDDIAGLEHVKNSVQETVLWPLLNPKLFQGVCSMSTIGVLLFGPPGTGKTMIGKAVAGDLNATFFSISASSLSSKWLGESEKLVKTLFELARHLQPSVIFLDEIDSLFFKRSSNNELENYRRLKAQLLVEMEGVTDSGTDQIVVIGATNRPQDMDDAARRRFGKRFYIPLPCSRARLHIVRNMMEKGGKSIGFSEEELDLICNKLTDEYSGSDMRNLVREAMMGPIRDAVRINGNDICGLNPQALRAVEFQDFQNATKEIRPSVSPDELDAFVQWNAKFGSRSV